MEQLLCLGTPPTGVRTTAIWYWVKSRAHPTEELTNTAVINIGVTFCTSISLSLIEGVHILRAIKSPKCSVPIKLKARQKAQTILKHYWNMCTAIKGMHFNIHITALVNCNRQNFLVLFYA